MSGDGIGWRVRTSLVLEALGAVTTVASLVLVVEVCRRLLGDSGGSPAVLVVSAVAVVLFGAAVQFVGRVLSRDAGTRTREALRAGVAFRLRAALPAGALHASWREHGTTLGRDISSVGVMVGRATPEFVSAVLVFVLSIGYLFWVDWLMALVTLLPILLGFGVFGFISVRYAKEMKVDYEANVSALDSARPVLPLGERVGQAGTRASVAARTLRAARELTVQTDRFGEYFRQRIGELLSGRALAEIAFAPLTVLVFVLCGGGLLVQAGWLPAVDLLPFVVVGTGLAAPLLAITYYLEEIGEGKLAATRLGAVIAGTREEPEPIEGLTVPETGVLTVVAADPRDATRVVATTSTQVPADRICVVDVEPAVVLGEISAYIADGRPAEAERCARIARVHDLVAATPKGYESIVDIDVRLSPAESQRLALARALAADSRLVVLDARALPADVLADAVAELAPKTAVLVVTPDTAGVGTGEVRVVVDGHLAESGTHPVSAIAEESR
ncbi:ABC transporter ATP-binding protein [Prauserella cavernicola]|uniref:ABC transporter ATP-binding protein n=1 Tax=Prauserella cavernicola TaxID=2800127 RepID=A0A934QVZ1_9PSEU|nr:ABC transporter ATP-binding protein [Prauserella cavernicola]MBK1786604.1 ABC transporter ATP-binding protein [Prauserella cavernicola]